MEKAAAAELGLILYLRSLTAKNWKHRGGRHLVAYMRPKKKVPNIQMQKAREVVGGSRSGSGG